MCSATPPCAGRSLWLVENVRDYFAAISEWLDRLAEIHPFRAFLLTSGVAVLLVAAMFHSVQAAGFILPATISASALWCWRARRQYREGESL
jgi:Flp pilus assembly protein TadB